MVINLPHGYSDNCRRVSVPDGMLQVAGKGDITITAADSGCEVGSPAGGSVKFSLPFTVTGGSGTYAGVTGSGTLELLSNFDTFQKSTLTGTITVPGLAFDTTAPTITGTTNKVVTVKHARGARVHYTVTAKDETDGSVPVTCSPRSRSLFRVGRTRVRCAAADESANAAGTSFTITVKSR